MSTGNEISDALALTVPCPLCNAKEGFPCVYVWPKGVAECVFHHDYVTWCIQHSDSQHERLAKVGTPTKVTHKERKALVFSRRVRERQLTERERLGNWLQQYGNIFNMEGNG